jgi:hypothetical protein
MYVKGFSWLFYFQETISRINWFDLTGQSELFANAHLNANHAPCENSELHDGAPAWLTDNAMQCTWLDLRYPRMRTRTGFRFFFCNVRGTGITFSSNGLCRKQRQQQRQWSSRITLPTRISKDQEFYYTLFAKEMA